MMNLARLAGFQDQSDAAARASADEMMMQAGGGQQGREGREFRRDAPVGQDQDVRAVFDGQIGCGKQTVQRGLQPLLAGGGEE